MDLLPFTEADRAIYKYFDGFRERAVDPLVIEKAIYRNGGLSLFNLFGILDAFAQHVKAKDHVTENAEAFNESIGTQWAEANTEIAKIARKAFDLPPLVVNDAGIVTGVNDYYAIKLLTHFFNFRAELERAARPLAISPSATD